MTTPEKTSRPDYPVLQRFGLLLRPLPPFFDWMRAIHPEEEDAMDPEFWEPNCYLLPELFNPAEEEIWLLQHFARLFDHELAQIDPEEKHWPEDRSIALFHQWFKPEFLSTIFDTVKGQIEKG